MLSDRPTKILHGYRAAFDPAELRAGGFMVGAEQPLHVHCHCGKRFDPAPETVKHVKRPEHGIDTYTVECPGCQDDLVCCGFDKLRNERRAG